MNLLLGILLALVAGCVAGLGGGWLVRLLRSLGARRQHPGDSPRDTVYLEPSRAKEILRELERRKEDTLSEIDRSYADRRRDFLSYLEGQREQIFRDLQRKRTPDHTEGAGPPPDRPKN